MKKQFVGIALVVAALTAGAQDAAEAAGQKSRLSADAGFDLRFRYEYKDNWMDKYKTTVNPKYEDYLRMRTRVWGKVGYGDDLGAYLRLGNEFRDYRNTTKDKDKNKFPDEVFIDNLYFDFKNIADRVDLRVGRQDIKEGAGRIISDGTPGDGSRSAYFDAVLATVKVLEKSDVDLMATWNRYRDNWTIGNPHDVWDNTKIKSGNPYSRMDEKGLMAYLHYNEVKDFPMEFYWVWKQEDRFYDSKDKRYPGRNLHTVGTRLIPKLTDKLSAELESALQLGKIDNQLSTGAEGRDVLAWMTYAGLTYSEKDVFGKPKLTGAILYLSGDEKSYYAEKGGSTDNSWNPVFNRASWFSEMSAGMYDQYRWSNLIYPHLELAVEPVSKHKVRLQAGPMFAAARDNGATDNYRGLFNQVRYDFPLLSKVFGKRGDVTGAVTAEALWYGSYYQHEAAGEDVATFVRLELNAKF